MHEQGLKLESLWRADQARDVLLRERNALEEVITRNSAAIVEQERALAELEAQLAALKDEERTLSRKLDSYIKQRDRAKDLIETGRAPDYRAAQLQFEQCAAIVDTEETHLLELYERLEQATAARDGSKSALGLLRVRLSEGKSRQEARSPSLQQELAQATSARDEARDGIEREWMARYTELRRRGQSPIAPVRAGACTACNVHIPALELAEHRRGAALKCCPSCGRFLGEIL